MTPVSKKYEQQLFSEGVLSEAKATEIKKEIKDELEKAYEASKTHKF